MFFREPGGNGGPSLFTVEFPGATSSGCQRRASRPIPHGRRCCREGTRPRARACWPSIGKSCLASLILQQIFCLCRSKTSLGNDVPSERLHLRRVELRARTGRVRCRCSWSTRKRRSIRKSWSRCFTRRWSIRMCQNFWPMFARLALRRRRRAHDGAQDRQRSAVAVRGSDHRHRHRPRLPDAQIRAAHRGADIRAGEALGAALRGRRHALRRRARRLVLPHHFRQRRRGRRTCVRRRDDRLHRRRRGPQLRPSRS